MADHSDATEIMHVQGAGATHLLKSRMNAIEAATTIGSVSSTDLKYSCAWSQILRGAAIPFPIVCLGGLPSWAIAFRGRDGYTGIDQTDSAAVPMAALFILLLNVLCFDVMRYIDVGQGILVQSLAGDIGQCFLLPRSPFGARSALFVRLLFL